MLTSAYRSKSFLLEDFGLRMHIPAIKAELCTSKEVGAKLHLMLLTIRSIKQGAESGKLKASAMPLPRYEPWGAVISKSPHPLPQILESRKLREHDSINMRGEKGGEGHEAYYCHSDMSKMWSTQRLC